MVYNRAHVFYSGRVQGVGFRFTAASIADDLGVLGWVRNLPDGRVEAVSEGEEKKVKKFLDEVAAEFNRYIVNADINWETPTKEFKDFTITF
jgi:acylphosphatase